MIDFVVSVITWPWACRCSPPTIISTPLKLLLLVFIDGWRASLQGLVLSYVPRAGDMGSSSLAPADLRQLHDPVIIVGEPMIAAMVVGVVLAILMGRDGRFQDHDPAGKS